MIDKLAAAGIESRPFFTGLHKQEPLRRKWRGHYTLPVTEYLGNYGLYLPSGPTLTDDEIDYVCETVRRIVE
jgi:perosamine synthetase